MKGSDPGNFAEAGGARTCGATGTRSCPYRFECDAVRNEVAMVCDYSSERTEAAIILIRMLCEARDEPCNHETLNRYYRMAIKEARILPHPPDGAE